MARELVLCYRKLIDNSSKGRWERLLYDAAYEEYHMQVQYFDTEGKWDRYSDLLLAVNGAEKLPFLVSGAINGYLQQLNGRVPDVVNNVGKYFLRFSQYQFEIIDAHRSKQSTFRIAVSFFTDPLLWLDTISNYLLLQPLGDENCLTHLFELRPYVNIHSVKEC
ncbi:hypothetical protein [Olivibacter sitiensis]|uniref:hypothetical protein n=1 Tax=Olivibacter sitiensis TaxID=376470 RepID=UPI0003FA463A|nr:hypothetical protein [Olivibacter sitiensis]